MSVDSDKIVLRLRYKLQHLFSLHENQRQKADQLQNKISELESVINEQNAIIKSLETQNEKLKLATAFKQGSGDALEAKRKIGKLVREIDKCVALLNQ